MSYQVLARKWRPRNFNELVGQEHVRQALTNALDNDRLHHAFLFTGTRGVGKTTIARILAKSLNCEQGIGSTPCGECPTCVEINEGRYVDLIEVDAASRTKVDETRELLENVQYAPTRGRYKVYLIDEVHMFSNSSFNALLKTLEEPPPHVKFLLATTDPQRLPATILSRCLQFNLKRLTLALIHDHLAKILGEEGIAFDTPALTLIARAADGSMRDALSLLDQAIAYGGGALREDEVRTMLGSIEQHHVIELLERLADNDASALLQRTAQLAEQSPDFAGVLAELTSTLHRIALAQAAPEAIGDEQGDREAVLSLAGQLAPEDVQLYYQIALIGRRDLSLAPTPRGGFEMVLLRMLAFRPDGSEAGAPPRGTAKQASPRPAATTPASQAAPAKEAPAGSVRETPPAAAPAGDDPRRAAIDSVLSQLRGKGGEPPARAEPPSRPAAPREPQTAARTATAPAPTGEEPPPLVDDVPPMPDYLHEAIPAAHETTAAADATPVETRTTTEPAPAAAPEDIPAADEWETLVGSLGLNGVNLQLAMNCALKLRQGNHFELAIAPSHAQLLSKPREDLLREAVKRQLGDDASLSISVEECSAASPATRQKQRQAARQRQAEVSIEQDRTVQALRETFAAQVNPGSVQPID